MPRTSPEEQERARQEWADREAGVRAEQQNAELGLPSTSLVFIEQSRVPHRRRTATNGFIAGVYLFRRIATP